MSEVLVLAAISLNTQVLVSAEAHAEPQSLEGQLLGHRTVLFAGRCLPKAVWRRRPTREFVFRLLDAAWVDRDRLTADLLYPDLPPAKASAELRRTKWHIQHVFGCPAIVYDPDTNAYGFDQRIVVLDCDTTRFERQMAAARRQTDPASALDSLRATLALYHGPFLPGEVSISGWIERRRADLSSLYIEGLGRAAELATALGRFDETLDFLSRARDENPDDVQAGAALLAALQSRGHHGRAPQLAHELSARWPQDGHPLTAQPGGPFRLPAAPASVSVSVRLA